MGQSAEITGGNSEAGKGCEWQIVVIHSACGTSICYNMFGESQYCGSVKHFQKTLSAVST